MVTPDVEPRLLLMIDEAAELTIGIGKAKSEAAEATALLDSILRRGRSCGVVVVALTQDPRVQAMPLRPRFPQRLALRLNSEVEARMALGDEPGTCWYADLDTGTAQCFRAPYVDDDTLRMLGAAADA